MAQPQPADREAAFSLLFVLPILGLLSVFLLALTSTLRLEQRASANRVDGVRAELVAEAGLARAIALLTEYELREPISSLHAPWAYRRQDARAFAVDFPLERSRHPSFKAGVLPSGQVYSSSIGSTYGGGDVCLLKVIDAASKLNLNGGSPELPSMLDALGRAIRDYDERRADPADPLHDPEWLAWCQEELRLPLDPIQGRGERILALRDSLGGSFTSLRPLEALLGVDEVERLSHYVTLHSWRDPRYGNRAPVNVNTASWPVLVSCFVGLEAASPLVPPLNDAAARAAADVFLGYRHGGGVFSSSEEVREFVEALIPRALKGLVSAHGQVAERIFANATPLPNDHGEITPRHMRIDPVFADFRYSTTPFCFVSHGRFEVTALARVHAPSGDVVAEARCWSAVSVYESLRLATQEDFEMARAPSDRWEVESHPRPVGGLAGPATQPGSKPGGYAFASPAARRDLRWRAASKSSGYVQPAHQALGSDFPQALVERTHAFSFGPGLKGSVVDSTGPLAYLHRPKPGGPFDQVQKMADAIGVHPAQLGELGLPNPTPKDWGGPAPRVLASGLLTLPESADDLRYPNEPAGAPFPLLSGSMALQLRFRALSDPLAPVPLLQARIRPDPVYYQGLDPTTDFVDLEVEAQLIKDAIYVRTRINSYRAPLVPNDPALPPALGLDRASVERHHVFETKGPSSLWHELYIPVHLNAHAVWVDGKPTRPARPAEILPWPAPAWTTIQVGDVVPGGLAEDRGDYSKGFLVSDLRVTTFRPGGGLEAVKQALAPQPGHPYAPPAMSTRYRRRGSDVMGSLRLRTRPLPPGARVGAVVVNEYVPKTFNQHVFHDADFLTQVSSRTRGGPLRRHVSGRVIPPPAPARFADPHFRYWRLRWLDEYCARMRRRAAHYRRLVELARGDAAALPALQAALAQVEESLRTLGAERDGLLSAYGREPAPRGASANDPERVLPQQASDCLDLQLDFLFLNQLAVPLADGFEQAHVALTIDEVIVPVATGARVLARRWE